MFGNSKGDFDGIFRKFYSNVVFPCLVSVCRRESQQRHFLSSDLTSAKDHGWTLNAVENDFWAGVQLKTERVRGECSFGPMEGVNLASLAAGATVCSRAVSYCESPLSNILAGRDWMADTFMKPPVSLTVHLAVPVRLSRLEWRTRVGRQSSLHHEVQVITDPAGLARHGGCDCQTENFPLYRAGSGRATPDGRIVFLNRRLPQSSQAGGLRLHCREDTTALDRVCAVVIKIVRTASSSVPCLAQLNIVGLSTGAPRHRQAEEKLINILRSPPPSPGPANTFTFFGGDQAQVQAPPTIDLTGDTEEAGESKEAGEAEIPTEFLDSITHSLMRLPMTLPSGHHVDRETVERCEDMFRTRGTLPRDPFTGKIFSQAHKPAFNADLKARIDRFLLTRSKLPAGGRTLGNAQSIEKFLSEKTDPARIGEKRKLNCDNMTGQHGTDTVALTSSSSDREGCEDDLDNDNNDLNEALKRTLAKRKKISQY